LEELHAALVAATRSLRAVQAQAQTLATATAATGARVTDDQLASELSELRQAAGDVHRAVAVLVSGTTGHANSGRAEFGGR